MKKLVLNKHIPLIGVIFVLSFIFFTILKQISSASGVPWVQTDWSGGVGGNTTSQFSSSSNIDYSVNGQVSLSATAGWSGTYISWGKRKSITINNPGSALSNYQVRLSITYDSDMKANFDDLRFTNSSGTALDYWLEKKTDSTSAIVWVEVDSLNASGNTSIYMYYGNSGASTASSGVNTFPFFDDFSGGAIDGSKWTEVDPRSKISQTGGKLMQTNGDGNGSWDTSVYSNQTFTRDNWSFEFDMKWTSDYSPYDAFMWGWKDGTSGSSYTNLIYGHYNQGDGFCTINCNTSPIYEQGSGRGTTSPWSNNTNYLVRERMRASGGNFYEKSIDQGANWTTDYTSTFSTDAGLKVAWMLYSGDYEIDNARVRKWVTSEPTSTYDVEVNQYSTTGTLTSNIYDTSAGSDWGNLTYTSTVPANTTLTVKVRAGNQANLSDASNFSACSNVTSGSDLTGGCTIDNRRYVQYEITLTGNGILTPTFNDITIDNSPSDIIAPTVNASSLQMYRVNGGTSVSSNGWTSGLSPKFSWSAGTDETGIKGYCIYLVNKASLPGGFDDQNNTDLTNITYNSSGLLNGSNSPVSVSGSSCSFIVPTTEVDFSNQSFRGNPWLVTSTEPYYLFVKVIDVGNNLYVGPSTFFKFRVDITLPTNVSYIFTANFTFGNVSDMNFSWLIAGNSSSADDDSGVLGWQYQLNSTAGTWEGTDTDNSLSLKYIPSSYNSFPYYLTSLVDGPNIQIGNNVIYFRTVDYAGNFSAVATIRTGNLAFGGAAPSFPGSCDNATGVTVTPTTSTSNSFSLSWPAATPAGGRTVSKYYYMVNTQPPATLATITSNTVTYIGSNSTSIASGALSGVVKGSNTVYVVAVDDIDIYSSTNCLKGTFNLNSTLPDSPLNLSVSDTSIKSASVWRASLAWSDPTYKGTGILSYKIDRSEDGSTWTNITTTNGNAYLDTVSDSKKYYWRVGTMDNTVESQASPTYSNAVTLTPKGVYTEPPTLTSIPKVIDISTKKAKVIWTTGREADSKVAYGVTSGTYFEEEAYNSEKKTDHLISLTNLSPSTSYYFVARWTDEDGNTGSSQEQIFTTEEAPRVKDVSVSNISISSAIIKYSSRAASAVKIYYGKTTDFGSIKETPTSPIEASYTTQLVNLEDGTKYYYKINSLDVDGNEYQGTVLDFTTLPRPRLTEVTFSQIRGTAQPSVLVSWTSNTEVSTVVTYYEEKKPAQTSDNTNPNLIKGVNRSILKNLQPETDYAMVIKARDKIGNEVISDVYRFTTAIDTRPPAISSLKIEAVVPAKTGEQAAGAQIIVSWNTDKPATSQVEFGEGTGGNYSQKTQEETTLKQNHLVVISDLTPSKVYSIRALSRDKAGNIGKSNGNNTLTPKSVDSALDIVITILSDAFGFLNNIQQ
jgi:hypothetical protein